MSAFNDFQKAWAKRFPGCELPKAWEDDVRANLEKRRQKLAELKEELEKEKFYVEYLEQQLADAERVKKNSISKSESCESVRESEKESNTDGSGEADAKLSDSRKPDSKKSTAGILEAEIKTQRLADQDEFNSYVTVIEVGGSLPSAPTAKNDSSAVSTNAPSSDKPSGHGNKDSDKESPPTSLQQKKKPPAPPKKPRKSIPIQAVPPVKKTADTEPVTDDVQPDTKLQSTEQDEAKNIPDESVCLVSEPAEVAETENKPADVEEVVQTKSAVAEERTEESSEGQGKRDALGESISLDSAELETDSCDGENIYDTVAGEDADLADETLTKAEAKSEDTGDYVVFSELASEAQSTSDSSSKLLQDHQYNSQKSVEDEESPEYATYMNIDYFLRHKGTLPSQGESDEEEAYLTRSFSSDHEMECSGPQEQPTKSNDSTVNSAGADDVFEMDSGVYSSSVESTSYLVGASTPPLAKKNENDAEGAKSEAERITMYKCILNSILESEAVYVECLNMLLQYMKALKCTIGTPNQLLSLEDFNTIFYRIPELHSLHQTFLRGLDKSVKNWDGSQIIGDGFKVLASKLGVYGSFLQNYSRAIETVRKCSVDNSVFSGITKSIKLKALQGQATNLEDLLHKPVARVQKNALVLHDLLRYTPENHPDHKTLKTALKMTQCFLNDINVSATEGMFPVMDRAQRHLVKNSFIVELSESHRKLRHLFLFSDVIVCAKYKPSTRQKFTFEVKWFIPLSEVVLPDTTDNESVKENSPFDILSLKSRASNVRDQILKEEKSSQKTRVTGRNIDKHKKKLAELEAQLVLASPNLVFRIGQKIGKTYTFFLSSEFERSQWIEAISILQSSAPPSVLPISPYELQAWLTSCRKHFGTNLGTFLLRSGKDEDLLVGDLHVIVHRLHGLTRPSDIYLCFEVDSYGHFFNKAKTKVCTNTLEPIFEQDFIIELEGSQTLRILCYENHQTEGAVLRGKGALELSRSWLTDNIQEKSVSLQDLMLTVSLKYEPPELSIRRIPSSKSGGVFGVKVQQVCKKEKSLVPFIIISCIREVEKRGMHEVGIYRVSGSASDIQRLKKSFESNVYEAEQLMKEVDIHSVTGLFKMYLRELPEALFTDALYQKFFHAFSSNDQEGKKRTLLHLFSELPEINQKIIEYLLDHMIRINQHESTNKMSLHNLATVFGPTLLRPGTRSSSSSAADLLTAGTVDVMAQAGIFYFFLRRRAAGLPLRLEAQK